MPCPRLIITLLAASLACATSPGTTTGDASTSTAAESTGSPDTQATHNESTAATHDESTHDEPTTTAHASTTEHTTGSTGHHGSEATGDSTATGELSPVDAYCACMLVQCHDQYHGTWGEEHESSEAMCVAAAEALPSVGMPVTMGNSLECRQYYCQLGEAEPGACDSAIGGGACV